MSYIGQQYPDNSVLFNGTLSATGTGSAIDTTGYVQSVWQVSGSTFSGIITVENSLDGVYWTPTFVTELASLGQKSQIEVDGVYLVKADSRYIRYNVTNISGTATLLILGNNYLSSNPVDRVSLAMDETNNSPLNVKLQVQNSGIKQDLSGAFILSDAPQPVTVLAQIGSVNIIDTTGYQTIHLSTNATFAAASGVAFSNDGVTFGTNAPLMTASGAYSTALSAATSYTIPVLARFARITATTGGQFTYVLRNTPAQLTGQNLLAVGGAAINPATAQLGVNIQQTGGTAVVAVGATQTALPLSIGGVDPVGASRRLTSTMLGDLIIANRTIPTSNAAIGSATTGNAPIGAAGYINQVALTVQDTSQYEGQSQIEILALILQELKIMNQQIFELPRLQQAAFNGSTAAVPVQIAQLGDEPKDMRDDASLFGQQQ
jgi:hypothetical protein